MPTTFLLRALICPEPLYENTPHPPYPFHRTQPRAGLGCIRGDAQAAYAMALQWVITGEAVYRDKAMAILNDWGATYQEMRVVNNLSPAEATGSRLGGTDLGVREGRRIRGRYTVTVDDLIEGRRHADSVCRVHFPIDVHSTQKEGASTGFDAENSIKSVPYDVSLRALIAADVDNLMMAGRNISGDFIAHSSYRVTGNSVAMGEAAGAFAATAIRQGAAPADYPSERVVDCLEQLKLHLGRPACASEAVSKP